MLVLEICGQLDLNFRWNVTLDSSPSKPAVVRAVSTSSIKSATCFSRPLHPRLLSPPLSLAHFCYRGQSVHSNQLSQASI